MQRGGAERFCQSIHTQVKQRHLPLHSHRFCTEPTPNCLNGMNTGKCPFSAEQLEQLACLGCMNSLAVNFFCLVGGGGRGGGGGAKGVLQNRLSCKDIMQQHILNLCTSCKQIVHTTHFSILAKQLSPLTLPVTLTTRPSLSWTRELGRGSADPPAPPLSPPRFTSLNSMVPAAFSRLSSEPSD